MNKKVLAVSLSTLALGGVLMGTMPKSDSVAYAATGNDVAPVTHSGFVNRGYQMDQDACLIATEENKALIEQGYNALTTDEKAFYDQYFRAPKVTLSDEELNKYETITDKVHQYLDSETKEALKARHEERSTTRDERRAQNQEKREARLESNKQGYGMNQEDSQGMGRGQHRQANEDCIIAQ